MLADGRRRARCGGRRRRVAHRVPDLAHLVRARDPAAARVRGRPNGRSRPRRRPPGRPGRPRPSAAAPTPRPARSPGPLQQRRERGLIRDPVAVRDEPRVERQFGPADHLGEPGELAVVAAGDRDRDVRAPERLVRHDGRVHVAQPARRHPAGQVGRRLVDQPAEDARQQLGADVLAPARCGCARPARRGCRSPSPCR